MEFLQNLPDIFGDGSISAFLISSLIVTLAEMGDKTQLLTLVLLARYRQPWAILWGLLIATLLNHALAAWIGSLAASWLSSDWLPWILGVSFILMGFWILVPDKLDADEDISRFRHHAFVATLILFFLAEMGDKTQIATVAMGAQFDSLFAVILGTTLGMLLANVPVLLAGQYLLDRLPIKIIHRITAALFILLGLWTLLA